jgi:hypothetical protein
MLELFNIRISFLCRRTYKNDENKYPIVMRIVYRCERRDIFTGLYCGKKEWDSKHNRLFRLDKYSNAVNENLDLIQRKTFEAFENLKYNGVVFTIDELVEKISVTIHGNRSCKAFHLCQSTASHLKLVYWEANK